MVRLSGDPPDPAAFTDAENWTGGFYELAIEVGDTDDERLDRVLGALWRAAGIRGCQLDRDREPDESIAVPPARSSVVGSDHLYGRVDLPGGARIVCGVYVTREDRGSDWVDFYLPTGALARVDARLGGFPFFDDGGPRSLDRRRPIDDWLARVGAEMYDDVGFRLRLIGYEVFGDPDVEEPFDRADPPARFGYLFPESTGVRYVPATR
ncbi:hypothetical protein [Micromonospora sp. NPDC049282]|uniref:hypothetical protein n=1 Tax=Micromonospora sp. NPDC049282 TaxID=3364269 RepID=UPI00371530C2